MPKDISLKSDRGPSTVSRNPRDFALGALRGGGEKLAQELMAAGMTAGVPYGPQLGAKARQALGAERDAYIEEQASIPWYEQALDMAKGIVRAPYVMVQGVTGDDPGGFGESVGRSSVPDAYAYATKPGEMVEASPVAAGMEAMALLPQGKLGKFGRLGKSSAKATYKQADRLGRVESRLDRSLGGVHYVRHNAGDGVGGYVSLNPDVNPPIPAMADAWKLGYKLDDNPIFNYNPADLDQIREYALSELRSPENLGKLSESIQSSGIREPLIVSLGRDGRATLVEGNHRHQVAMDAGLDSVPVRFNHQQAVPETSRERAMRPVNPETKVDVSQPMPQDGLPPAGRRGSATEAEMDALMDLLTGWGRK